MSDVFVDSVDALLAKFEQLPRDAPVLDLSNRHITPSIAIQLLDRMAADPSRKSKHLVGIDLDGNRLGTATADDLRRMIRSLKRLGVCARFGFEVFMPRLKEAMDAEEDSHRHVTNVIPWWMRDVAAMSHEHARLMQEADEAHRKRMAESDEAHRKRMAESDEAHRKRMAESDEAHLKRMEAMDAASKRRNDKFEAKHRQRMAALESNLATIRTANEAAEKAMRASIAGLASTATSTRDALHAKVRAMSRDMERKCCLAVAEFLTNGRVIAQGARFTMETKFGPVHGEFDGVIVGSLHGEDLVVLLEVKTNVAANLATAVLQCTKAKAAWRWFVDESNHDKDGWHSQRAALRVAEHHKRRVLAAIGGSGAAFPARDVWFDDSDPWLWVSDEGHLTFAVNVVS
jgi:hypothetical protein